MKEGNPVPEHFIKFSGAPDEIPCLKNPNYQCNCRFANSSIRKGAIINISLQNAQTIDQLNSKDPEKASEFRDKKISELCEGGKPISAIEKIFKSKLIKDSEIQIKPHHNKIRLPYIKRTPKGPITSDFISVRDEHGHYPHLFSSMTPEEKLVWSTFGKIKQDLYEASFKKTDEEQPKGTEVHSQ